MPDSFEVAQSSSEDGLSVEQQHEVVAAQLRGEAKAAGQAPEAVVAAVAAELEDIGLEPDPSELHRRYEEIDPDIPELTDVDRTTATCRSGRPGHRCQQRGRPRGRRRSGRRRAGRLLERPPARRRRSG